MGLESVFLSVRQIVLSLARSTMPSSTTLFSNSRKVQRAQGEACKVGEGAPPRNWSSWARASKSLSPACIRKPAGRTSGMAASPVGSLGKTCPTFVRIPRAEPWDSSEKNRIAPLAPNAARLAARNRPGMRPDRLCGLGPWGRTAPRRPTHQRPILRLELWSGPARACGRKFFRPPTSQRSLVAGRHCPVAKIPAARALQQVHCQVHRLGPRRLPQGGRRGTLAGDGRK
jgi:hypothetical protein